MKQKHPKTSATCCPVRIAGTATLGERGQIVVPKDVRDHLGLVPGSQLVVLHHENGAVVLVPAEQMKEALDEMNRRFSFLQQSLKNS